LAANTPYSYRNLVLYEIYVRAHGPNGTFAEVEADLERIGAMGVDVIWFMPIHRIGKVNRKGELGSPYSIADYRSINPEYGSNEDFKRLIRTAHNFDLKVLIDVVYNHTAHDSNLVREHPHWYHQNSLGEPVTTVPAWSDVIDLKYPNPELETYLIDTLVGWVKMGVDGFRCDVASIVPVDFWLRAREQVAKVNPQTIWLAESVHAGFVSSRRDANLRAHSDCEVFAAFDLAYDYDIWPIWQAAVTGQAPVGRYLEMVRLQNSIYPENYVKMRCVENHDQARIQNLAPTRDQALAWTAFEAFNKGAFMIYAGQEAGMVHTPSLFIADKINWDSYDLQPFLTSLTKVKKEPAVARGIFTVSADEPAVVAHWESPEGCLLGIFNLQGSTGFIPVSLPDGSYLDLISGDDILVSSGQISIPDTATILRYRDALTPNWFYSLMFDLHIPSDSQG